MITFTAVNEDMKSTPEVFFENLTDGEYRNIKDVLDGLLTDECDTEFAACVFAGALLIRVFDMGRYLFLYPYEISESANVASAIDAVVSYAIKEELPLVFCDVPCDELSMFRGFRHMHVDAEDDTAGSYRVRIKNECELLEEVPKIIWGRVTLNEICEADIEDYATLAKDENVNKYWGYNYSEDVSSPTDSYFLDNARLEFRNGVSVSTAVRVGGRFCGESILYAFDGRGACEVAIRLLPAFQGQGIGNEAVEATLQLARKIGLTEVRAKIFSENERSVHLFKKLSDGWTENGGIYSFTIYLN